MSPLETIEDLRPATYNPREITEEAAAGLAQSLERFGDISGIVWNKRSGNLVAGHQRVDQLRKAGASFEDGALRLDGKSFTVRVVDWDESTERAANVTANNPLISGGFTEGLQEIIDGIDLDHFGDLRLDDLIESLDFDFDTGSSEESVEIVEDEVPEPPAVAVTRPGDLWVLGEHRVLCGDATIDIPKLMDGATADLFSTDPPYGVAYGIETGQDNKFGAISNDENDGPRLQAFLEKVFSSVSESLRENAAWYLWHAQMTQGFFAAAAAAADVLIHRQIIWVKPSLVLGHGDYHWRHGLCFYGWKKGNRARWFSDRKQTTIWEIGRENDGIHPTQKPVEIFAKPILFNTEPGEICLEPFTGSGTQIIAAEQLNRSCYGIEIEPRYVDVIVERWEQFSGGKATRK